MIDGVLPKRLRGSPAPFRVYAPIFLGDLGLSLRAFSNGATKLYSLSILVQMLARLVILGGPFLKPQCHCPSYPSVPS
jgi:hypothetical protein